MDSILTSIKKLLGIDELDTHFDSDIIMHINSNIAVLCQVGVGPDTGFEIEDKLAVWADFIPPDINLSFIKSFIHIKVKLLFDPPQNSSTITLMEKQADEFLWRIEDTISQASINGEVI